MHIVWVNDHADFTGGCEHHIYQTVQLFSQLNVQSTLLYKLGAPNNTKFMSIFDQAYPMVDLDLQMTELAPDVVYVHGITDLDNLRIIVSQPCQTVRFFHDQKLFCLREHKYTAIGNKTCDQKVGIACYTCLGFIKRSDSVIGVQFKTLRKQREELAVNQKFDQFVVGSAYMAQQLERHGFRKEKITTAILFSQPLDSMVSQPKFLASDKFGENKIQPHQLLFVGQLVRGKGLDTLIKAISQCRSNIKLIICGTGSMESRYKALVSNLKLESNIQFMGRQSTEQLNMHYQKSAAVVIPARAPETFCLVGLEALQHGTPVIATNVGGMSEWFKHNFNGLEFEANSEKQLANVIERLVDDSDMQLRLRNNIANDNYDRFSPNYHISVVHSLFERMLEAS
jgi:glycosyltransferase involved in cell wall biosynthesis